MYGVESHTQSFRLLVKSDGRTFLKGFTEGFVYHSVLGYLYRLYSLSHLLI